MMTPREQIVEQHERIVATAMVHLSVDETYNVEVDTDIYSCFNHFKRNHIKLAVVEVLRNEQHAYEFTKDCGMPFRILTRYGAWQVMKLLFTEYIRKEAQDQLGIQYVHQVSKITGAFVVSLYQTYTDLSLTLV